MKTPITHRKHHRQGFSLPEVTLALGIAAFGITTLLGLLPQGLSNIRKAGDVAAASRISQHILGALDQTPTAAQRYYFDAYAVPVDPAGKKKDDIAYVAEVAPPKAALSLPGAAQANDAFLQRVEVRMKQTTDIDYDFEQADPASYRLYSHIIARTGK